MSGETVLVEVVCCTTVEMEVAVFILTDVVIRAMEYKMLYEGSLVEGEKMQTPNSTAFIAPVFIDGQIHALQNRNYILLGPAS